VERLCNHLAAVGEAHRAAVYAVRAAERAESALAFDQAADWYARALALGTWESEQERALRVKQGDCLANAGRGPEAAETLLSAAQDAGVEERAWLGVRAAGQQLIAGDLDRGLAGLRRGLTGFGFTLPEPGRAWELYPEAIAVLNERLGIPRDLRAARILTEHTGLQFGTREDLLRSAQAGARAALAPQLWRVDALWWMALGLAGYEDVGLQELARVWHLNEALTLGEPTRIVRGAFFCAAFDPSTVMTGAQARFDTLMQLGEQAARSAPGPYADFWRHFALAYKHFALGEPGTAAKHCALGAQLGRASCHGISRELAMLDTVALGMSLLGLGRYADCRAQHAALQLDAARGGDAYAALWADLYDPRAFVDDGNLSARAEHLERRLADAPFGPRLLGHRILTPLYGLTGRAEMARAALARLEKEASQSGALTARNFAFQLRIALADCMLRIAARTRRSEDLEAAEAAVDGLDGTAAVLPVSEAPRLGGRAACAWLRSDRTEALALLDRTLEAGAGEHGNRALGLAAQRQRGLILGGNEGALLVTSAELGLRKLTVRNPARLCARGARECYRIPRRARAKVWRRHSGHRRRPVPGVELPHAERRADPSHNGQFLRLPGPAICARSRDRGRHHVRVRLHVRKPPARLHQRDARGGACDGIQCGRRPGRGDRRGSRDARRDDRLLDALRHHG
jgi:hypothetical protein